MSFVRLLAVAMLLWVSAAPVLAEEPVGGDRVTPVDGGEKLQPTSKPALKMPPDGASIEAVRKLIDEAFKSDLASKRSADRVKAAEKIRGKSEESDDPAAVYTLLLRSAEISVDATDLQTAFDTIDAVAEKFAVNSFSMKLELLEQGAKGKSFAADPTKLAANGAALTQAALDAIEPQANLMSDLADAWWELPTSHSGGISEANPRRRAGYQRALPELKGLKRQSAESRIKQLPVVVTDPRLALKRLKGGPPERVHLTSDGLVLAGASVASPDDVKVPFRFDITAKTDAHNIRLVFAGGSVIFDWEVNPHELRHRPPGGGDTIAVPGQGFIKPGEWGNISWILKEGKSTILVNGKERASFPGNFGGISGRMGVFTDAASTVTIRSWKIETVKPN